MTNNLSEENEINAKIIEALIDIYKNNKESDQALIDYLLDLTNSSEESDKAIIEKAFKKKDVQEALFYLKDQLLEKKRCIPGAFRYVKDKIRNKLFYYSKKTNDFFYFGNEGKNAVWNDNKERGALYSKSSIPELSDKQKRYEFLSEIETKICPIYISSKDTAISKSGLIKLSHFIDDDGIENEVYSFDGDRVLKQAIHFYEMVEEKEYNGRSIYVCISLFAKWVLTHFPDLKILSHESEYSFMEGKTGRSSSNCFTNKVSLSDIEEFDVGEIYFSKDSFYSSIAEDLISNGHKDKLVKIILSLISEGYDLDFFETFFNLLQTKKDHVIKNVNKLDFIALPSIELFFKANAKDKMDELIKGVILQKQGSLPKKQLDELVQMYHRYMQLVG